MEITNWLLTLSDGCKIMYLWMRMTIFSTKGNEFVIFMFLMHLLMRWVNYCLIHFLSNYIHFTIDYHMTFLHQGSQSWTKESQCFLTTYYEYGHFSKNNQHTSWHKAVEVWGLIFNDFCRNKNWSSTIYYNSGWVYYILCLWNESKLPSTLCSMKWISRFFHWQ